MTYGYFAYQNLVPSSTLTARSGSTTYPVTNLAKYRLWPGYRSADRCVNLDGSTEYAWVADHADFDITGDLTIEALIYLDPAGAGTIRRIVDKAGANDGYLLLINTIEQIQVYINGTTPDANTAAIVDTGNNLSASTWYRIKITYDASAQEVSIYQNGIETARVNNSTQTSGTLNGTIPTAITANATRVTIGASSTATQLFEGKISYVCIDNAESDNGGYIQPTDCAAYWKFDDDLTDSSGNSHTLTGVNIAAADYENCTAYQWINTTSTATQSPTLCFIDRRHNLSTGATVNLLSGPGIFGFAYNVQDTATVTAGEPIVLTTAASNLYWWLEIHDPDNSSGYIEIPYVYIGTKTDLNRGFDGTGYPWSEKTHGSVQPDSAGGYTGYVRSEQLWEATLVFKPIVSGAIDDLATFKAVSAVASKMRPIIFSENGTDAKTRAIYWIDAQSPQYQKVIDPDTSSSIDLITAQFKEIGGGL